MRLHCLGAFAWGCVLAMGAPIAPVEDDADHNRRNLKTRHDFASVEATYNEVHDNFEGVKRRYKPILEKLVTNKAPSFLQDFMSSIKGFTSDLSWVANQPAVSSMLFQDPAKEPGAAPLPSSLTAGPGLPDTKMCGGSGICKDVVEWVRNVNENFRSGTEPSPLQQVALQNQAGQAAAAGQAQATTGV